MLSKILNLLLEEDDEVDMKGLETAPSATQPFPGNIGAHLHIYDAEGRPMSRSRNLRGLRRYLGKMPVVSVSISELGGGEGGLRIVFANGWFAADRWASFGVLKHSLRNWRNLQGAPLEINGVEAGTISYRNPMLQEGEEDDFDAKDLETGPEVYPEGAKVWVPVGRHRRRGAVTQVISFEGGRVMYLVNLGKGQSAAFWQDEIKPIYEDEDFDAKDLELDIHPVGARVSVRKDGERFALPGMVTAVKEVDYDRFGHTRIYTVRLGGLGLRYFWENEVFPPPVQEGEDDFDTKDLEFSWPETSSLLIKETPNFVAYQVRGRGGFIQCKLKNHHPRTVRISHADVRYLSGLSDSEFDGACLLDFGCGAFQRQMARYPRFTEALLGEDEDFEAKDLEFAPEQEVSLEQIKAAQPRFFSRRNTRFFGTRKVYKYGNFLVVKNVRLIQTRVGGGTIPWTAYIIYEFTRTPDCPQGDLHYRGNAEDLYVAKQMIKRRDFRSWRDQLADMNQRLLGEDEDFDVKELLGDYESPWRFVCRTNPDRIAVYFEDKFVGGEMGSDDGVLRKLIRAVETIRPFDPAKYVNLWDWMADNRVDYQSSRQRLDPGRRQNEDLDDDFDMKDLEGSFPPLSEVKFDARADFETDISYRREFRDDPEVVDWIHAQLSSGNEWAWASVTVTAKWTAPDGEIYVGNDYLGGCSYKSKADFIRNSDYYPQMKDDAYEDLQDTLQRAGLMEAAEEEDFDPNDMGGEGWSFGRWAFDFPADYPKDIDIYCEGNITATARVGNQSREDLARDLEAEIKQAEAREPFDRNHRFVGFWDWLHDRLI